MAVNLNLIIGDQGKTMIKQPQREIRLARSGFPQQQHAAAVPCHTGPMDSCTIVHDRTMILQMKERKPGNGSRMAVAAAPRGVRASPVP